MGKAFSLAVKGVSGDIHSPKSIMKQIELLERIQIEIIKKLQNQNETQEYIGFFNTAMNSFKSGLINASTHNHSHFSTNGLKFAVPYKHIYEMQINRKSIFSKHIGAKIGDLFKQSLSKNTSAFYANQMQTGNILVNEKVVNEDYLLQDQDVVTETVELKLEPPVYDQEMRIIDETSQHYVVDKPASLPLRQCGMYKKNTLYYGMQTLRQKEQYFLQASKLPKEASGLIFLKRQSGGGKAQDVDFRLSLAQARVGGRVHDKLLLQWVQFANSRHQQANQKDPNVQCSAIVTPLAYCEKTNTTLISIAPQGYHPVLQDRIRHNLLKLGHPVINDMEFGRQFAMNTFLKHQNEALLQFKFKQFNNTIWQQVNEDVRNNAINIKKGIKLQQMRLDEWDVNRVFEMCYHEQEMVMGSGNQIQRFNSQINPLWLDERHLEGFYFDQIKFNAGFADIIDSVKHLR